MQTDPTNTTPNDLITAALKEAGALSVGQSALAEDITDGLARMQWMLQQWERKRWLVYHLVTRTITSTGAQSYTVGPGGQINTNQQDAWNLQSCAVVSGGGGAGYAVNDTITVTGGAILTVSSVNGGAVTTVTVSTPGTYTPALPTVFNQTATSGAGAGASFTTPIWARSSTNAALGVSGSARPARLESAFLRQLTQSQPNQIDYPLEILESREDYNRIALKQLSSFPGYAFYDSEWPLGNVYAWPVPQASIYSLNLTFVEQLPPSFATLATKLNLPYEYYQAIVSNLAIRLMPKYGIVLKPGDPKVALAKDALNVIRGSNLQIARLQLPKLNRPFLYNIFSDRFY